MVNTMVNTTANSETMAQCLPCKKQVQMVNPKRIEGTDGKHPYMTGICPECGRTIRRWLRTNKAAAVAKAPKTNKKRRTKEAPESSIKSHHDSR